MRLWRTRDIVVALAVGLLVGGTTAVNAVDENAVGTSMSVFGECTVNALRCPNLVTACETAAPGDPCIYCELSLVSSECVSGINICIQTKNGGGDCGIRYIGICGPSGCEGVPTADRCPRFMCTSPFTP